MGVERTRVDRAADEAAIRAVEAAYDRAWDAGDVAAILRLCDADVVVIDPFGGTSVGREGMGRLLSSLFDGDGKGSTHSSDIVGVHFVTDDVALADGEATIEGFAASPAGGESLRHRFTDVLVRGLRGLADRSGARLRVRAGAPTRRERRPSSVVTRDRGFVAGHCGGRARRRRRRHRRIPAT